MQPINVTIKPGDKGIEVINLQQVLQLLSARSVFKTFNSPNSPSTEDLRALFEKLATEQAS